MVKIKDELDNLTGTIGNLIYYQRNGKTYVRTKPVTYRDAKTEKQVLARGRFAGCNRFYDLLRSDLFRRIWKVAAEGTGKNAKNLFVQHNIYAFGKEKEVIDYSRLKFSTGLLPLPNNLFMEIYNNRDCILRWEFNDPVAIGFPTDRLYIVELKENFQPRIHETKVCRSACKAEFSTSEDMDEKTHLYCFWGSEQGTSFSETYCFEKIDMAGS